MSAPLQTCHVHIVTRIAPGQYAVTDAQFIPVDWLFVEPDEPSQVRRREWAARYREAHREQERERVQRYRAAAKGAAA